MINREDYTLREAKFRGNKIPNEKGLFSWTIKKFLPSYDPLIFEHEGFERKWSRYWLWNKRFPKEKGYFTINDIEHRDWRHYVRKILREKTRIGHKAYRWESLIESPRTKSGHILETFRYFSPSPSIWFTYIKKKGTLVPWTLHLALTQLSERVHPLIHELNPNIQVYPEDFQMWIGRGPYWDTRIWEFSKDSMGWRANVGDFEYDFQEERPELVGSYGFTGDKTRTISLNRESFQQVVYNENEWTSDKDVNEHLGYYAAWQKRKDRPVYWFEDWSWAGLFDGIKLYFGRRDDKDERWYASKWKDKYFSFVNSFSNSFDKGKSNIDWLVTETMNLVNPISTLLLNHIQKGFKSLEETYNIQEDKSDSFVNLVNNWKSFAAIDPDVGHFLTTWGPVFIKEINEAYKSKLEIQEIDNFAPFGLYQERLNVTNNSRNLHDKNRLEIIQQMFVKQPLSHRQWFAPLPTPNISKSWFQPTSYATPLGTWYDDYEINNHGSMIVTLISYILTGCFIIF